VWRKSNANRDQKESREEGREERREEGAVNFVRCLFSKRKSLYTMLKLTGLPLTTIAEFQKREE
jgi:predicted transposase YdaD